MDVEKVATMMDTKKEEVVDADVDATTVVATITADVMVEQQTGLGWNV